MNSKVMIGVGVAAAAAIGLYLYSKKGTAPAGTVANQSDVRSPEQGQANAYAPPAGGGGKSTTDKVTRDVADIAKADAECSKQNPDKTSFEYLSCMALKGASTL